MDHPSPDLDVSSLGLGWPAGPRSPELLSSVGLWDEGALGLAVDVDSFCRAFMETLWPSCPVQRPWINNHTWLGHLVVGLGLAFFPLRCVFTSPIFSHRMDDSYCLSALRSPFYPIPTPGSLPPLHPSAMHLHLSGVRYPPELSHSSLAALHSERMSSLSAER